MSTSRTLALGDGTPAPATPIDASVPFSLAPPGLLRALLFAHLTRQWAERSRQLYLQRFFGAPGAAEPTS